MALATTLEHAAQSFVYDLGTVDPSALLQLLLHTNIKYHLNGQEQEYGIQPLRGVALSSVAAERLSLWTTTCETHRMRGHGGCMLYRDLKSASTADLYEIIPRAMRLGAAFPGEFCPDVFILPYTAVGATDLISDVAGEIGRGGHLKPMCLAWIPDSMKYTFDIEEFRALGFDGAVVPSFLPLIETNGCCHKNEWLTIARVTTRYRDPDSRFLMRIRVLLAAGANKILIQDIVPNAYYIPGSREVSHTGRFHTRVTYAALRNGVPG